MKPSRLSSSKPTSKPRELTFEAIGTLWQITYASNHDLESVIRQRIEDFDRLYSRFRPDSLVTKMSRQAGTYALPADAQPLLDFYQKLYELSGGAVTPLIGQLLSDAGYDAKYSLKPGVLQPTPAWDDVLNYKFPQITLKQSALLDFGAAGKGYLVDLIGELLEEKGIDSYTVDAGGDIRYRSKSQLAIGLEHPDDPTLAIGVAQLSNRSLCGSAGNRRRWADFNHIMDPRSQASSQHLKAVWVIADSTMLADGLTTALYFVAPEKLKQWYDYEYVLVRDDMSLSHSPGFPAEFYTT